MVQLQTVGATTPGRQKAGQHNSATYLSVQLLHTELLQGYLRELMDERKRAWLTLYDACEKGKARSILLGYMETWEHRCNQVDELQRTLGALRCFRSEIYKMAFLMRDDKTRDQNWPADRTNKHSPKEAAA